MSQFTEKTAVVTGGCSGIGLAIVKTFLQQGIENIAILDLDDSKNITQSLQASYRNQNVIFIKTDVSKKEQIKSAYDSIIKQFKFIDFVVNNAGIICEQDYEKTINVNLFGVLYSTYTAIEVMSKEKGGRGGIIIGMSSIAGLDGVPSTPAYCTSKHGIVGLNRSFGDDFYYQKFGIKFITICPGATETPILVDFEKNANFGRVKDYTETTMAQYQAPEIVAQRISEILKIGKNGSFWTIHDGEMSEVILRNYFL